MYKFPFRAVTLLFTKSALQRLRWILLTPIRTNTYTNSCYALLTSYTYINDHF